MVEVIATFEKSVRSGWEMYSRKWREFLPLFGLMFGFSLLISLAGVFIHGSAVLAVVFGAFMLMLYYLTFAVTFAAYNRMNDEYDGKAKPALDYVSQNFVPALKYGVFVLVLGLMAAGTIVGMLVLIGSAGVSTILSGSSDAVAAALGGALVVLHPFIIVLVLAALLASIFLQFTEREMAAGREGLVQAVKNSISLAKGNFIAVFVLGILFAIAFLVIVIPYVIINIAFSLAAAIVNAILLGISAIVQNGTQPIGAGLVKAIFGIPGMLYLYLVLVPLEYAILLKYWRLLKGIDKK